MRTSQTRTADDRRPTLGGRACATRLSRRVLLGAALIVSLALLLEPTPASATSRYVLEKCDSALPGGGVEGAVFTGPAPFTPGNNCAEAGGALIILQGGATTSSSASWTLPLPPPPGGSVESVTVTAELCSGTNHDPGTVAWAVQEGWALACAPETRSFPLNSTLGSAGTLYLGCQGSCEQDPFVWAHYFAAVEVDPVAPQVTALTGSLVSGTVVRGHQTIGGVAEDLGGGVSQLSLRVDGQPSGLLQTTRCATYRASNPSYTGLVTAVPTPCPVKATAEWTVNTGSALFQEGANTVSICAEDFSTIGPPNESCSSRSIVVDNSCAESAASGEATVNARFAHMKGVTKAVRYGKGAKVTGRLVSPGGTPVPGATICIALATEGSKLGYKPTSTTTTDAEGRFSYYMAPGPNRTLRLAFRHDADQVEKFLTLQAHAGPTLGAAPRALKNGESVTLRGTLPRPARAHRVVVLQAAVPGAHRWITFRKATTGEQGRFKATYHFTSTTRKITYRFRAVVPRQSGYPWLQGTSKSVRVTVTR